MKEFGKTRHPAQTHYPKGNKWQKTNKMSITASAHVFAFLVIINFVCQHDKNLDAIIRTQHV